MSIEITIITIPEIEKTGKCLKIDEIIKLGETGKVKTIGKIKMCNICHILKPDKNLCTIIKKAIL